VFARCPAAGPHPAAELRAAAREEGFSDWALRCARERLGVVVRHSGFTVDGAWVWKMPAGEGSSTAEPTDSTKMSAPHEAAHLATPHIFHTFHIFGTDAGDNVSTIPSSLPLSTTSGKELEGSEEASQLSAASAPGHWPAHMHEDVQDVQDVEDAHPSDMSIFGSDAHLRAQDTRQTSDDGTEAGE
jgi:hypothetical protein